MESVPTKYVDINVYTMFTTNKISDKLNFSFIHSTRWREHFKYYQRFAIINTLFYMIFMNIVIKFIRSPSGPTVFDTINEYTKSK